MVRLRSQKFLKTSKLTPARNTSQIVLASQSILLGTCSHPSGNTHAADMLRTVTGSINSQISHQDCQVPFTSRTDIIGMTLKPEFMDYSCDIFKQHVNISMKSLKSVIKPAKLK